jgi:hypothetical protein
MRAGRARRMASCARRWGPARHSGSPSCCSAASFFTRAGTLRRLRLSPELRVPAASGHRWRWRGTPTARPASVRLRARFSRNSNWRCPAVSPSSDSSRYGRQARSFGCAGTRLFGEGRTDGVPGRGVDVGAAAHRQPICPPTEADEPGEVIVGRGGAGEVFGLFSCHALRYTTSVVSRTILCVRTVSDAPRSRGRTR